VVAFAVECQDPDDIEGSTRDPDVIWITRIEQLDATCCSVTSARSATRKIQGEQPDPVIVGHASPMYRTHSLVNTTGDRRNVRTISRNGGHGHPDSTAPL
jgi:hypothetical protein